MFRWHRVVLPRLLSVLVLLIATPVVAQCPNDKLFDLPLTSSTFPYPLPSAVGDFNNDGIPDLVVGTGTTSFFAIMLGEPTHPGTFQPPVSVPTGTPQADVVVGDFDGDGVQDIAVTSAVNQEVYVSLGLGGGKFGNHYTVFVGAVPRFLKAVDINRDGYDDLVLISGAQLTVVMASGLGAPNLFLQPMYFTAAQSVAGLTIADINGDGIRDALISNSQYSTLICLYGQGSAGVGNGMFGGVAGFPTSTNEELDYNPVVTDLNGDGAPDVIVGSYSNGWVYLGLLAGGVPTGTFARPYAIPLGGPITSTPIFADLNHDGHPDLVVPHSGGITVLAGLSGGQLTAPTSISVPTGSENAYSAHNINVADFTVDGALDVAGTTNSLTGTVWVLPNICSLSSGAPPAIVAVEDVPLDQGGRVKVSWARAGEDVPSGRVQSYWLWRSVPARTAHEALSSGRASLIASNQSTLPPGRVLLKTGTAGGYYFWEFVGSEPAAQLSGYSYVASTTNDSTSAGNPLTVFFVQARNPDGSQTWASSPDSGYSVDNLPPGTPMGLAARFAATNAIRLHWNPNRDPDLSRYELFRGNDETFAIGATSLVGSVTDTMFTDTNFAGQPFYKLSAVDVHGNRSEPALLEPQQISGVELTEAPAAGYLRQNYPNPFNPSTTIEYGVADRGAVTLRIFDPFGHLVRTLIEAQTPAGRFVTSWDGKNDRGAAVASGLYVVEIVGAGLHETRRMTLIR